jgi:GDP-mannose 6-dehydrogenase
MLNVKTSTHNGPSAKLYPVREKAAISVVGLGYVGAVSTACLSSLGHTVIGVDIDKHKITSIAAGKSPIHEHELDDLLHEGVDGGLISATDDLVTAVQDTNVTFLSVGTPTAADGGCDYSYIEAAAFSIGEGLRDKDEFHVVVMRCSIPPGVTSGLMVPIIEEISGKTVGEEFGVCFNPEFLREGVAVADFYAPPKTVIGASDERSEQIIAKIYAPVDQNPIFTSIETAEMVKYVDNVWHATKVCFANEVGRICKPLGVDSHSVMDVFVQDTKLNLSPYYLKPGFAFGGSCLPKEVRAVAHLAEKHNVDAPMITALTESNTAHINQATSMVLQSGAKRVGIMGLAFKPGTDDLRESPILEVISALIEEGIEVQAYDDAITPETQISAQLSYVRHASPGLQKMAEKLPEMMQTDCNAMLENIDTVIVTHANPMYRETLAAHPSMKVIDVVRLFSEVKDKPNYDGIGW